MLLSKLRIETWMSYGIPSKGVYTLNCIHDLEWLDLLCASQVFAGVPQMRTRSVLVRVYEDFPLVVESRGKFDRGIGSKRI